MTPHRARFSLPLAALLVAAALAAGCGNEPSSSSASSPPSSEASSATPSPLLKADLVDALPVLEAMKKGPGDDVAVVGRVRETGKGVFQIVDDSFDYCGRSSDTMDGCATPWDYCCLDQEQVANATIVVLARTPDGKPIPKADLGIRSLDLVALRGKLEKNDRGDWSLTVTSGWFRRERPVVGTHVQFE